MGKEGNSVCPTSCWVLAVPVRMRGQLPDARNRRSMMGSLASLAAAPRTRAISKLPQTRPTHTGRIVTHTRNSYSK